MNARSKHRSRTGTPYWKGNRAALQSLLLGMPLHLLADHTHIAPARLVAFGNGSARPTIRQVTDILTEVVYYAAVKGDRL